MPLGYLDNTPAEQPRINPYISQYVPLPFEEFLKVGAHVQKRGDDAMAGLTEAEQKIANSVARNVDLPYLQGILKDFRTKQEELIDSGVNPASQEFKTQSGRLIQDFVANPDLKELAQLKTIQDERRALEKQLKAQGKYLDFNKDLDEKPLYNQETGERNQVNTELGYEQRLNRQAAMENYFNNMKESDALIKLQASDVPGFLKYGTISQITDKDIRSRANAVVDGYINTTEGNQEFRELTQLQGMSPEQARATMLSEIMAVGQEKVNTQIDQRYLQDPGYFDALKRARDKSEKQADFNNPFVDVMFNFDEKTTIANEELGKTFGLPQSNLGKDYYQLNADEFAVNYGTNALGGLAKNRTLLENYKQYLDLTNQVAEENKPGYRNQFIGRVRTGPDGKPVKTDTEQALEKQKEMLLRNMGWNGDPEDDSYMKAQQKLSGFQKKYQKEMEANKEVIEAADNVTRLLPKLGAIDIQLKGKDNLKKVNELTPEGYKTYHDMQYSTVIPTDRIKDLEIDGEDVEDSIETLMEHGLAKKDKIKQGDKWVDVYRIDGVARQDLYEDPSTDAQYRYNISKNPGAAEKPGDQVYWKRSLAGTQQTEKIINSFRNNSLIEDEDSYYNKTTDMFVSIAEQRGVLTEELADQYDRIMDNKSLSKKEQQEKIAKLALGL